MVEASGDSASHVPDSGVLDSEQTNAGWLPVEPELCVHDGSTMPQAGEVCPCAIDRLENAMHRCKPAVVFVLREEKSRIYGPNVKWVEDKSIEVSRCLIHRIVEELRVVLEERCEEWAWNIIVIKVVVAVRA